MNCQKRKRPCIAKDLNGNKIKGLFHVWSDKPAFPGNSDILGIYTVGLVEDEQGNIFECYPYNIKFTDKN